MLPSRTEQYPLSLYSLSWRVRTRAETNNDIHRQQLTPKEEKDIVRYLLLMPTIRHFLRNRFTLYLLQRITQARILVLIVFEATLKVADL
jgi:hypothetical protein